MKKIAYGLQKAGVVRENIAILSTNRMEFVEVFLGIIYAGCIPIPLDPKWSTNEVTAILQQCQPKMIFAEATLATNLNLQDKEIRIFTFSAEEAGTYDKWLTKLKPEAEMDCANELLFIGFTSGTTGIPKGYMRTHLSWIKSFEATREAFQFDVMEHILAPGPFVQSLSLFALMQSLYYGATFHIIHKFNAMEVLQLCKQVPDAILFVVPTMIESMMQQATPGQTQIQALISSGAKWSEGSKKRAKEMFGETNLYEFYGSSEASYISYLDVFAEEKSNSVGGPFQAFKYPFAMNIFKKYLLEQLGSFTFKAT